LPRPDVQPFLDYLRQAAANGMPGIHQMPLVAARASYVAMQQLADLPPEPLAVIRDLACPGPAPNSAANAPIPLRLYDARPSRPPGPALVFYHGGGFVLGGLDSHHNVCTTIARSLDLPLIAVDYRLAPEHPFPAAPDDAEAAARWIAHSPAELGRTITGLVPIGDSAGGTLAIVVTQALMAQPAAVPVVAQVPIYPLTDEATDHASMAAFGAGFLLQSDVLEWFVGSYRPLRATRARFRCTAGMTRCPPRC
jgi:acetyl esterase